LTTPFLAHYRQASGRQLAGAKGTSMTPSDDAPLWPQQIASLDARFRAVRSHSAALAAPLSAEDQTVQSMPDASPAKWHLAHTTWFFETFVLAPHLTGYQPFDPAFAYLFNSYYEAAGPRHPRAARGLLTRPTVAQVLAYRAHVDAAMQTLLADPSPAVESLVVLGLAHEQQHQELLLMDILHLFSCSPLDPAYDPARREPAPVEGPATPLAFEGGLVRIGHDGSGFAFDNESPRHSVWLEPYRIADRLVTNADWLEFMAAGGYAEPKWWLSEGWAAVQSGGWTAPLYWRREGDAWLEMTLAGLRPLDPAAPVRHISYYEADAYAAFAGARLPTEAEWEHAAEQGALRQACGQVWQWTRSSYGAYPGFAPGPGALGEYNGKFMVGQLVLRGGSALTPPGHTRPTYRNFFYPGQRWVAAGLRLAWDGGAPLSDLARDVAAGLSASPKSLPPKHFYDAQGSRLFEAICELPEYYPTRTETALLRQIAPQLSALIPADSALVEFGSGAGTKVRLILEAAPQIAVYAPIDISHAALDAANVALAADYPSLIIAAQPDDFTRALQLPEAARSRSRVGFFPGSTIGNFDPAAATAFLANVRTLLGSDSLFIVGYDMVKDIGVLEAAYNDSSGVTAAFNLNLLARINRELGADFDLSRFGHRAFWNPRASRIEMHLVSTADQTVHIGRFAYSFAAGETIHTENAHKFTESSFAQIARAGGWRVVRTDQAAEPAFAISVLAPA
jgi:dimethylhistidine N-methyltransferase